MVKNVTQEETTPHNTTYAFSCHKWRSKKGDKPPPVAKRRTTRPQPQPRRETRTECLEQRIDTLTELINTLVTALGQNAANVTPAIPWGSLLLTRRVSRLNLIKKAGMPRQTRPRLTLVDVEGALGVNSVTLCKERAKIEKKPQNRIGPSTLGIWCSIGPSR